MKEFMIILLATTTLWSTSVTFKGEEVTLNSQGLKIGDEAPIFHAVDKSFKEVTVGGKSDKIQVIAFVPSFDTGVCRLETIAFNEKISKIKDVVVSVVSKDLPFAIERFCHDNSINNVATVSDYKDANHALRYGATISAPAFLEGFFGRVVYIVDTNGKITYKEIVSKIDSEPNYKAMIKEINSLKK